MLHPLPVGPKSKDTHRLSAKAASRAEPPQDSAQADQKENPSSFQGTRAQARALTLGPQDGTDRETLLPLFPSVPASLSHQAHHWPWTDPEKDCHLLKTPHHFPTHLNLPSHLPPGYPTSWILLASSQRKSKRHTAEGSFYSVKRVQGFQYYNFPHDLQFFSIS